MKNKIIVAYDNWCPKCIRFANLVKKLDWLDLINLVGVRNDSDDLIYEGLNLKLATQQIASNNGNWRYGFTSIYLISTRLPLLWFFLPLMYILKTTGFGQLIYMKIAVNRKIIPLHCDDNICEMK